MTWRPSNGLKAAESVVQTILNDLVACGVPPITNPTARWRMVSVIGEALDGFRAGSDQPEFPLDERDEIPHLENGYGDGVRIRVRPLPDEWVPKPEDDQHSGMEVQIKSISKKRSRGRPKLTAAEKKKRSEAKAKKAEQAVEAPAS